VRHEVQHAGRTVGGGQQTPGFVGHSKQYIVSPKFISGDGGIARVVWMPKKLKEEMTERLRHHARHVGLGEDFVDKIADESRATTEEEVLAFITEKGHPALPCNPCSEREASHAGSSPMSGRRGSGREAVGREYRHAAAAAAHGDPGGEINRRSSQRLIAQLLLLAEEEPKKPIKLFINSPAATPTRVRHL